MSSTVAVFDTHPAAEQALNSLKESGFDIKRLSIIGKDYHTEEHAIGFYNAGDRMKVWGKRGAFWGGLWGWLFGAGLFLVPGVGHLLVLGPLVGWVVGALEGAAVVGSLGVLGGALASAGIPDGSVIKYETAIKAGKFVVTAHGNPAEVEQARAVLAKHATSALDIYNPTAH